MAYELTPYSIKFTGIAGADLSAKQYCFVKMSAANTVVICAAITDIPIGVLQNAPTSGQEAEVLVAGISKVKAGGVITVPSLIGTDASGLADAIAAGTDTTVYVAGQVITAAGAANDIITSTINLSAPGRAA